MSKWMAWANICRRGRGTCTESVVVLASDAENARKKGTAKLEVPKSEEVVVHVFPRPKNAQW